MAEPCQAYAHKYVGKGTERVLYEGQCALERGHDLDCLPIALAHQQMNNAAHNAAVNATKNLIFASLGDRLKHTEFWITSGPMLTEVIGAQVAEELLR